ncbi:hypothetical protein A2Z22_02860 [Candidatus Woesebacteria bacterium RBG_16_34_12]|uniref:Uncharacterized protein n=1 Tax=Candidatus Woesebacteria bacterium RBG_16_34_12 TaxID=1802480 RepID=A0A1F7X6U3_9BACT|nr:MAG: hypothetical protein A2Z22_02860 [Candidatus Woesebacteria bacterium RBG_16_34_12]
MNRLAQLQTPVPTVDVINGVSTIHGLEVIVNNIIVLALGFAGLALFIMLILGGFKYITSAGDPKKTESAKNTITYAILGLVLMALAYLILVFISQFTGVNVTIFQINQP